MTNQSESEAGRPRTRTESGYPRPVGRGVHARGVPSPGTPLVYHPTSPDVDARVCSSGGRGPPATGPRLGHYMSSTRSLLARSGSVPLIKPGLTGLA